MKLVRIEIQCYKSLIKQNLHVTSPCMALMGLNESGKTNVLDAIRMLNWNFEPTIKDKSKLNDGFPSVVFHFTVSDKLQKKVFDGFAQSHSDEAWLESISSFLVPSIAVGRSLNDEGEAVDSYSSHIDFSFNTKKDLVIVDDETLGTAIPPIIIEDESVAIESGTVLERSQVPETHVEYFMDLTKEHVSDFIKPHITAALIEQTPSVVYWEYSNKYLIPSEIKYDDFMVGNSPSNVSRPLYSIFLIADSLEIYDEENLASYVSTWQTDASRRRKDTKTINEAVNKYIKGIWKEYDQEFEVNLEAEEITVHMKDPKSPDTNYYSMEERSQGFKTFVSFLLTMAADSHLGVNGNSVLVLDEPETHLHPSGARFMKNELFELANQGNQVFFATHSIFMIDRVNLERHVVVEKQHEHSYLRAVDRNTITQESVIYEALGTHVDEFSIPMRNILFEGGLDRELFVFFVTKCLKKADNPFGDYTFLNGGGTKQITKFFNDKVLPQGSEWRVILDKDGPGRNLNTYLTDSYHETDVIKVLVAHYSNTNDSELEDILPPELIMESFHLALHQEIGMTETLELGGKSVSSHVQEFYGRHSITGKDRESVEIAFKTIIEIKAHEVLSDIDKLKTYDHCCPVKH